MMRCSVAFALTLALALAPATAQPIALRQPRALDNGQFDNPQGQAQNGGAVIALGMAVRTPCQSQRTLRDSLTKHVKAKGRRRVLTNADFYR